ncbi:MAG: hypothetical protein IT294_01075 [Deltaproteobacteria bacterium]|nr:hypothetical protein [Deltaproteobacteria bacterium]
MPRVLSARRARIVPAAALAAVVAAAPAAACDVCAVYTATEMREERVGWIAGIAEQGTRFETGLPDASGRTVDKGERLNSFITQLFLGYDFHPKFGVQVTVPIIARDYHRLRNRRLVDGRIQDGVMTKGNVSGFGDVAVIGVLRPWSRVTTNAVLRFTLLGGLEMPSGDPQKLAEEQQLRRESEAAAAVATPGRVASAHHLPEGSPSGINGHDLALGSGSIDGIVGGTAFASWKRLFTTWSVQHAIRMEGAYRYQYGDETTWFVGAGAFVLLDHDHTLALQLVNSGKHQGTDTLEGTSTAPDGASSALTFVYLGPALTFTWGDSLLLDLAGDLPAVRPEEGLRPQYRVRGGVSWRF